MTTTLTDLHVVFNRPAQVTVCDTRLVSFGDGTWVRSRMYPNPTEVVCVGVGITTEPTSLLECWR